VSIHAAPAQTQAKARRHNKCISISILPPLHPFLFPTVIPEEKRRRDARQGQRRSTTKKEGRGVADVRTSSRLSTSVAGIAHAGADSVTTEGWPLKGLGRRLKDLEGKVECDVGGWLRLREECIAI
jgi:hypothetical protein